MTDYSQAGDDDLLRLLRTGDEEAFMTLYRRRGGPVYRFALQMSGSAAVAEEVTQDVFLAVLGGAAGYDPARGTLQSWLYGVARNHVLRSIDRDRRYSQSGEEEPVEAAFTESPLDDLTRSEKLESVRQAVLALPPRYREVVALCDLQELSYEEAARAIGCAVGTVRSRLSRGRALLAEKLRASMGCSV